MKKLIKLRHRKLIICIIVLFTQMVLIIEKMNGQMYKVELHLTLIHHRYGEMNYIKINL